jgi:uncharacterized membrane protein YeaQ/YmgE (transglycosylase-associated protein family)
MNIDAELIGNEIGYLKPRTSKLKSFAEAVIGAALIIVFVSALLLLAIK